MLIGRLIDVLLNRLLLVCVLSHLKEHITLAHSACPATASTTHWLSISML